MPASFPKLLVATEFPPNAAGGGAAIVRQMLKGWPVEKLFWWSCQPERHQQFGQKTAAHAVATISAKLYPHHRARGPKCWVLENLWTPWAARHFQKTLDTFQPEAVWVIPHCWSIPPLAQALLHSPRRFHVSIHDYADVQGAVERFGAAQSRRLSDNCDRLYARATTRDVICQPMADDLLARTGVAGAVNRAGLEPEDFAALETVPTAAGETIRIAYAGTIIVEKEFALFVVALQKIRAQLRRPLTLEFFGDHSYRGRAWFDASWMRENGILTASELSAALKACTWGFSPMALTDDNPRYNQFSFPAKFTSYLAAGLPIITLGHPACTVVKMASAHYVGVCSSATTADALAKELSAALTEPDSRRKYQANLLRCARQEFDADRMRRALHENFRRQRAE